MENHSSGSLQTQSAASSDDAAAYLLALATADPTLTAPAALEAHRQRVAALRDPTSPYALQELSRQVPVLEALFHRFTAEALRATNPQTKAILLESALQAQQAHARTFTLIRGLALQEKGFVLVIPASGPDSVLDR